MALNRSYVIGGDSDREHFFPTNDFSKHLSPETAETCNTYNMLKLTRHLFEWEPSARLMDFYERGLYNQILASQDPDSGMMTYFVPLQAGRFKTYSTPLHSFWCCVGTGMENHAKYGDTIYFRGPDSLYVNLFISSELHWTEKGVTVRQETKFPEEETTMLTFDCASPVKFALHIRHPAWAGAMTVRVNGRKQKVTGGPGSYITIERAWSNQDKVELRLPMRLHLETLPGDAGHIAFLYGPVVLAGRLGVQGLPPNGQKAHDQLNFAKLPVPAPPALDCKPGQALALAKAVKGQPLTFQLKTTGGREILLIPFYQLHHERYAVYWTINNAPRIASAAGNPVP